MLFIEMHGNFAYLMTFFFLDMSLFVMSLLFVAIPDLIAENIRLMFIDKMSVFPLFLYLYKAPPKICNRRHFHAIGTASANSVEFRGIRHSMCIDDQL